MSKAYVIFKLFAVVYGLLLSHLFMKIHNLIRKKDIVRWHWLPLSVTWYLLLVVLKNWWDLVTLQDGWEWFNIYFLMAYGHLLVLVFLLVSAALPDKIPENGINLKTYYFQNHTYFWGVKSLVLVISLVLNVIREAHLGIPMNILHILPMAFIIALAVLLAISKKYWVHISGLIIFLSTIIVEIIGKSAVL